ncbi:hypothetical protein F4824DRAFT_381042 [Ustulina deusta]|nr:hypothetical protein F4824DRAFT_381042 [Ustulina deusta]
MVADDNPFVRFKNHIDSNVRRGLDVLFGSSVAPSTSTSTTSSTTSPTTTTKTVTASTSPLSVSPPSSLHSTMSDTSSTRASNAATSDHHHTTSPTSPTSSLAPSTTTASADDVHTWAVHSPYSPLNLQHLRQPTPRDAPRACDGLFTFRDAFEDLLVAGSGEPLPTAHTVGWKKCWQGSDRIPRGRVNAANWVNGLGVLGLWDAYFSLETGTGTGTGREVYRDERDRFQRRLRYRGGEAGGPFVSVSAGPGVRVGVEGWGRERGEGMGMGVTRGHFDARGVWDGAWRGRWEVGGEDRRRDGGDADVEDELYRAGNNNNAAESSAASSSHADSDSNAKDLTVAVPAGLRKPLASAPETTTTVYADGSRRVTKTERIERDGRTEILTTEHLYDADGNLLSESRGTSKTQTWSGSLPGASAGASFSWSWNSRGSGTTQEGGGDKDNSSEGETDGDGNGNGNGRWGGDRKDGKSGWFWQR